MTYFSRTLAAALLACAALFSAGCGSATSALGTPAQASSTPAPAGTGVAPTGTTGSTGTTSTPGSTGNSTIPDPSLGTYTQTGNTAPVRDPSMMREGNTYYVFSTDPGASSKGEIPIRCSADKVSWRACGYVFAQQPAWIAASLTNVNGLWAPDVSFFNGTYHLYYAASSLGSQNSAIGLATNVTLDPSSPAYQWVDQGPVLTSQTGDDFNAIDPNVFADADGSLWLNYGSYWSGIKQRLLDPATGMLSSSNTTVYSLASNSAQPALEGSSMVAHNGYYYLFASVNSCCLSNYLNDNYEQIVGRSTSVHGPFVDMSGTPMMTGGGTVLLSGTGNSNWNAPGGGTAFYDNNTGEGWIVFHAANLNEQGNAHLWVKTLTWQNDWPALQ